MSVGFVYKSVIKSPRSKIILTSRKVTDLFDHSAVNLIVGCIMFILSRIF